MERCPCCKARLAGATLCPRCQADLGKILAAEESARFWLAQAIREWRENAVEQSLNSLELSLSLKKTRLALAFRDFLIHRQCREILDLLDRKQVLAAKHRLYKARLLIPHSKLLQQLNAFADYLLAKNQEQTHSF